MACFVAVLLWVVVGCVGLCVWSDVCFWFVCDLLCGIVCGVCAVVFVFA